MTLLLGIFLVLVGVALIIYKGFIACRAAGKVDGTVPLLDGVLFAPTFVWFGISFLSRSGMAWLSMPWWLYFVGWLLSLPFAFVLLRLIGQGGRVLNGRSLTKTPQRLR